MSSVCDSDSGLSVSLDGSVSGGSIRMEVRIPDLEMKKSVLVSGGTETAGAVKRALLVSCGQRLRDAPNYGLWSPATPGKAGKFLLEERALRDYGLPESGQASLRAVLELRYKKRLYKSPAVNIAKLKKLHTRSNLKSFLENVGSSDIARVTKILNKGLDPNYQIKETGETPLLRACSLSRPTEMIKVIVEGGAHLDYRHSNGHTPLHAAAILGKIEAVKTLLDLGQSPNTWDLEGLTPLYHSIVNDPSAACTERLLYDYSIIGVQDENGLMEIHQACRFGRVQHLEHLLQYGADIDCRTTQNGNTPLHICAYLGQESCARLLLFRGADRVAANRAGHSPHQQALLSGQRHIALLIQHYRDEDIVYVKPNPRYNDKRKSSMFDKPMKFQRSRSTGGPILDCSSAREGGTTQSSAPTQRDVTNCHGGQINSSSVRRQLNRDKNLNRSMVDLEGVGEPRCSSSEWWPDWQMSCLDVEDLEDDENDDSNSDCRGSGVSELELCDQVSVVSSSGASGPITNVRRPLQNNCHKKTRSQSSKSHSSRKTDDSSTDVDLCYLPRMVVLQRTCHGFGFVIRGLKASNAIEFLPSRQHPALQYFEEIEPHSVASRAGLLCGDFILEINRREVTVASHEETVQLIKASGDILALKVVTVAGLCRKNSSPATQQLSVPMEPLTIFEGQPIELVRLRAPAALSAAQRPDSTVSIESVFPLPPPPPQLQHPQSIPEDSVLFPTIDSHISPPPVPRPISQIPPPPLVRNFISGAVPPPPFAPPPPPPPPPQSKPFTITRTQTVPVIPPSRPKLEFDSHLRQAIARRREKIDTSDVVSVVSFDDPACTSDFCTAPRKGTLASLKQHKTLQLGTSGGTAGQFERSRSEVYGKAPQHYHLNQQEEKDDLVPPPVPRQPEPSKLYMI